jgi:hypothetical protein
VHFWRIEVAIGGHPQPQLPTEFFIEPASKDRRDYYSAASRRICNAGLSRFETKAGEPPATFLSRNKILFLDTNVLMDGIIPFLDW